MHCLDRFAGSFYRLGLATDFVQRLVSFDAKGKIYEVFCGQIDVCGF